MTRVERVARAICRHDGDDPDRVTIDGPAWVARRGAADAAIEAADDEPTGLEYRGG